MRLFSNVFVFLFHLCSNLKKIYIKLKLETNNAHLNSLDKVCIELLLIPCVALDRIIILPAVYIKNISCLEVYIFLPQTC